MPRGSGPVEVAASPRAALKTLRLSDVTIADGMWRRWQSVNRELAVPHGFKMLEEAGNFEDLRLAAGNGSGEYRGPLFMDSDVYKWLEAAAFELERAPSTELSGMVHAAIGLIEAAQGSDDYLNSYYTVVDPGGRWTNFAHGHELYCLGHLTQAAVAHKRATGSDRLIDVARRFADHVDATFGPGRRVATPGHPEVEMALVELYRETRERRYLDLCQFFVDQRGHGFLGPGRYSSSAYYQDRVPIRESHGPEGHAVRAMYLNAGVTDLYLETGESALLEAMRRHWDDMVGGKAYLTGALGSRYSGEAFGQPFELPSDLAYAETCAAIGSIMWCWRMLLVTGEARFADMLERALYNAVLSGVSLDGQRYFYVNPLSSNGVVEHLGRGGPLRQPWNSCACCPPNVMRLISSIGHYFATRTTDGLQLHLYGSADIDTHLGDGRRVQLAMRSAYPWDGRVGLRVDHTDGREWALSLRVPEWCTNPTMRAAGQVVPLRPSESGYVIIEREWQTGEEFELELPMAPRLIEAHPSIESTRGCLAIERGPLVYCLEQHDQSAPIADLRLDSLGPLAVRWAPDLLDGVVVVTARGRRVDNSSWHGQLYRPLGSAPLGASEPVELSAIPYFAWANRGPAAMRVWIPRAD